ncbi:hypothetical protein [Vulcanisaeta sp. JCM 14467]
MNATTHVKVTKSRVKQDTRPRVSRARRGEFTLLWLIVTVVAIVMAVVILYFVYASGMRVLSTTNIPTISASASSGILTVNIKNTGIGSLAIYGITLYAGTSQASCTSANYYLDGQSYTPPSSSGSSSSSGPLVTLKPGQTFTVVYSSSSCPIDEITSVQVMTSAGAYTVSVT